MPAVRAGQRRQPCQDDATKSTPSRIANCSYATLALGAGDAAARRKFRRLSPLSHASSAPGTVATKVKSKSLPQGSGNLAIVRALIVHGGRG